MQPTMSTVYIIYMDMNSNIPDIVTLDWLLAATLKATNPATDYVKVEMQLDTWMDLVCQIANKGHVG